MNPRPRQAPFVSRGRRPSPEGTHPPRHEPAFLRARRLSLGAVMFCYLFYYTGRQTFGFAIPGIPNVVGPDAGFDNAIRRVAMVGRSGGIDTRVQIQGYRALDRTVKEVMAELPGWKIVGEIPVTESGPEDLLA